ncbi:Hypothetical predicted protein [Mytilus galloprovincialis]|uniref:Uncharacterized protein n=1 Tax=Mytilus galloprovincialis TaxID=29158 RepID=A0A8B6CR26_MYTGA|nr:Hypothetical predicted protein [Mytilus galloprovincialis]
MDKWTDRPTIGFLHRVDHESYKKTLEELGLLQKKCLNGVAHQRYRMKKIHESLKRANKSDDPQVRATGKELNQKVLGRKNSLRDMEDILPHKNGLYLSIILGQVSVSLLNKADKSERGYRPKHFRIKGQWKDSEVKIVCLALLYMSLYGFIICVPQMDKFFYQKGSLYRLRALGQGHDMDVTVEGFMSWMFKGLVFLLPFLFAGYFFQMYNAYTLFKLSLLPQTNEWQVCIVLLLPQTNEWQVTALAIIHFILSVGNITTTLKVVQGKIQGEMRSRSLTSKYKFNNGAAK